MVLLFSALSFSDFEPSEEHEEVKNICKFKRLAEVERECNADWVQEAGSAPLMLFDESDMPKNFSGIGSTLKLASFWLMGMDFDRKADDIGYLWHLIHGNYAEQDSF